MERRKSGKLLRRRAGIVDGADRATDGGVARRERPVLPADAGISVTGDRGGFIAGSHGEQERNASVGSAGGAGESVHGGTERFLRRVGHGGRSGGDRSIDGGLLGHVLAPE